MPECCLVTEEDQNQFLLRIYAVTRTVAERLVRKQHVDDVVHDIATLCLIRLRQGRWRAHPQHLGAFVVRMVLNVVISRWRKTIWYAQRDGEHLRCRSETTPSWMSADRFGDEASIVALRQRVLSQLPARCQRAYYLVREDRASYAEAAAELGVARGTVHHDVVLAQRALRAEFRARGYDVRYSPRGGRPRGDRRRRVKAKRAADYVASARENDSPRICA